MIVHFAVGEVKADKCYEYLRKFWDRFGTDRDCLQAAATYVALYKLAVKIIFAWIFISCFNILEFFKGPLKS